MYLEQSHQSHHPMGVEQIKKVLHLRIEQADESFLRILYAMTEAYASEYLEAEETSDAEVISTLPPPGPRLTMEELINEIEEANAEIGRGECITSEELEKETEKW